MLITFAKYDSPQLKAVQQLWRANTATLGYLPDGAFDEHSLRQRILISLDKNQQCTGYLLYRISDRWAVITHLCVDQQHRGVGIARQLVDHLYERTGHLIGVKANCRRDYGINSMWPKLGFVAVSEKPGRAKNGSILTCWHRNHNHPTLFTEALSRRIETRPLVLVDSNIFYDWYDQTRPSHKESSALLADWLQEEIELAVSGELLNEINRGTDTNRRIRERSQAEAFTRLVGSHNEFEATCESVRRIFPVEKNINDEADIRQIAHAIVEKASFFITRDTGILNQTGSLYTQFGISIRRPSTFIIDLVDCHAGFAGWVSAASSVMG